MAIFSKPKDPRPPVPERCHRCGQPTATVRLHFTAPIGENLAAHEREAWICDECVAAVRRARFRN